MSVPASAQAVFSAVSNMEDDIRNVRGFASVLMSMGSAQASCHPKALSVLGCCLDDLADRLEIQFDEAFQRAAEAKR